MVRYYGVALSTTCLPQIAACGPCIIECKKPAIASAGGYMANRSNTRRPGRRPSKATAMRAPHGLPPFTAATLGRLLTPAAAPAIIAGREEQRGSGGGLRTPLDSSNNKCVPNVRSTIAGRGEQAQVVRRDVERNEQCRVVPQCTASQMRVRTALTGPILACCSGNSYGTGCHDMMAYLQSRATLKLSFA